MSVRVVGVVGLVVAMLLGACDSAGPRSAGSRPSDDTTSPGRSAAASSTGVSAFAKCNSQDARRQRSSTLPVPQRATSPVQLGPGPTIVGGHSPDLLPAPMGAVPKVTARAAWQTADLPTVGGGSAAILLGTYPGEVPRSPGPVMAWLVYAAGVAITNGYPWHRAPPVDGIRGACAFGYLEVSIDATTGHVLRDGYDINP